MQWNRATGYPTTATARWMRFLPGAFQVGPTVSQQNPIVVSVINPDEVALSYW
jgi:hypothetical protein